MLRKLDLSTIDWTYTLSRLILITLGVILAATAVTLFFVPSDIAPGGITGIGVILQEFIGAPLGLVIILGNIPIQILGFIYLKGWKTLLETIFALALYSFLLEVLPTALPTNGLTDDTILNALFGGILGGVGAGLVYRAGGTMGGTSTLARIGRQRFGLSMSNMTLYTDTLVLLAAVAVFGWEAALYATVAVFINRMTSDYVLEGSSDSNTALIMTKRADLVSKAVSQELERGVTIWRARGMREGDRDVVMVTLSRTEVTALRKVIQHVNPEAFVTVLEGRTAYGNGFKPLEPQLPLKLDAVEDGAHDIDIDAIRELERDRV